MDQAVADGLTVSIKYHPRIAKVLLDTKKVKEIERYYKTDKGSMRERLFQHFCIRLGNHSFHILICIFTELDFSRMLQLGSVCLIREADNIVAVIDKTDLIFLAVTEFLNRADIEPATFSGTEFLPQMLSVLHHRNITEIQELLALGKQLDTLLRMSISMHGGV